MNKKRLLAAALLLSMPLLSGCSSMVSEAGDGGYLRIDD